MQIYQFISLLNGNFISMSIKSENVHAFQCDFGLHMVSICLEITRKMSSDPLCEMEMEMGLN